LPVDFDVSLSVSGTVYIPVANKQTMLFSIMRLAINVSKTVILITYSKIRKRTEKRMNATTVT